MILLRMPMLLAMVLYQSLFLALAQIRASKMRSALTMLGIVIGVASVTTVIAALTGLRKTVLSEFETLGTNKIFMFPRRPDSGPMRNASWLSVRFKPDIFDGMTDHCPSVECFTRITDSRMNVTHGARSEEGAVVVGIEPAWHRIESRWVTVGRPFTLLDNDQFRPVCLINGKLRDKLALDRDCIGQSVMIGTRRFVIVGVLEDRTESSFFGRSGSQSEAYIPFNTAWQMAGGRTGMICMAAARSPEVAEEARAEIAFFLRKQRQIKPGQPDTFMIEFVERFVQAFNQLATAITLVATGIVGISLLVGGVGIMNIMLVSVSERTREIGLRKALGAPPAAILLQFLVEAVMLCLVGGLIGVLVGYGLTRGLASIPNARLTHASIPAWAIALSFGFAASVGLAFGLFPAIKAARLDPIEALRHE